MEKNLKVWENVVILTICSDEKLFSSLVFVSFSVVNVDRVELSLLHALLESGEILPGLGELSLLHALTDVPVDEGSLGVHQVELVVQPGPGLGDGGGVGEHADSSGNLSLVSAWNDGRRLVVDANLEPGGTPVNKLDAPLGLDGGDGGIDVLGDHVAPVEETAGHVLAMPGVALHHLVGGLEAGVGDLPDSELLVVSLLSGDDGSVGDQREVDPGVGHQVGLELGQINIESSVKSQRGRDGGDNLTNQTVEIGVGGPVNVQVPPTDVVDGLVVDHKGAVRMLQGGMGSQDSIVRFDHSGGHLRSRVDGELKLGLLSVVNGKTLHHQGSKSRPSTTSKGVEKQKSLKSRTLVSQFPDSVQNQIHDLLANGVVAPGVVVGGVLLAIDQLLGMVKLTVGSNSGLVNDSGLQVNKDGSWNMFSTSSLREEGLEGVVSKSLVRWHASVRLDTVLKAVELPTGVSNLDSSLSNMHGDTFSHLGYSLVIR